MHLVNVEGIKQVTMAVPALGPYLFPVSANALPFMLEAYLEEHVTKKFQYLHLS